MSRERISELIGSLEQLAAKAVAVRIGFASIDRSALDALLSTCGILRRLLEEDGRYGYIIEQVGWVQQAARTGSLHDADANKCRSDLDGALTRLTSAWRQTGTWRPTDRDGAAST